MRRLALLILTCLPLIGACLVPTDEGLEAQASRSACWNRVRADYLAGHARCEACGGRDRLQVHHVIPFNTEPSRECDPTNLITLCAGDTCNCHLWVGHGGSFRSFNPNCREDAVRFAKMVRERQPNEGATR